MWPSIAWAFVLFVLALGGVCGAAPAVSFKFSLAGPQRTSAGVFKEDGTLVRTIWSGVPYPAGVNSAAWDGMDDFGNLVPDGAYVIRVLSNSCTYTWEGVLGNSSASFTGQAVWKSYNSIGGLAISGTTAYFGNGYAEAGSTSGKFSTASPNSTKQLILDKGADVWHVATDGKVVYWSGQDPNVKENTFVFGTDVSDDHEHVFASGEALTVKYGFAHKSVIGKRTDGSPVSGLAVQKAGPLLFIAHADRNELVILNKTTGALVNTITDISAPSALAVDSSDNLWVVRKSGTVSEVAHYSVRADGALTPRQTLKGTFDTPLALGVSPDRATIVVVDGGASQQLKAFTMATGAAAWTFGQEGGYTASPTVSDDRFLFESPTFVAFQPDGSFWVGDYGNGRIQHYSAARAFLGRVQYRPVSYFCAVDPNNATRVFSDFLEYAVDYAKPLAPDNGSWSLVRNWTKLVPADFGEDPYRRIYPCTLANKRTYALLQRKGANKLTLFELTADGKFRDTGVATDTVNASLQRDGSLRTVNLPSVGGTVTWTIAALTGFDGEQNPIYAAPTTLASTVANGTDPAWWGDSNHVRAGEQTAGGIVVSFDHGLPDEQGTRSLGYHLGGVRGGGTGWLWRTSLATHKDYAGPWPEDGAFDIGNGVRNAGSVPMTVDRHIFYGYYGEFYRGSQTNKYRHYYENGLLVADFGQTGESVGHLAGGRACAAQMAGNAINPWVVKLPDGRVYLYHNDESWHGGVHRWRIDGLNTVAEQSIPIRWTAPLVAGLFGEYFDTPDLDDAARKSVRADDGVNFSWGAAIPPGTALTASDTWSARWSGFITPRSSETYTFFTATDGGVRLWVDGKLIIDQWKATGGEQSGTIALTAGQSCAIKMEYVHASGAASAKLSWSSDSQHKELIPKTQLRLAPWLLTAPKPGFVDLLAGQPAESTVENKLYGVTRDPEADLTSDYWDRWFVRTDKYTYRSARGVSRDVSFIFNNNTPATRTFSRDLGPASDAITQWTLSASVNYTGNIPNTGSITDPSGGQYFDVLDDAGLIIARFHSQQFTFPSDYRIVANKKDIAKDTNTAIAAMMEKWQPLTITATRAGISFSYGGNKPVIAPVFDRGAKWQRAKTLRIQYFCAGPNGPYGRALAMRDATFSRVPASAAFGR